MGSLAVSAALVRIPPMELKEALVIVLAFLAPLTVYCVALAAVNRRRRPVVVSGAWDFLGLVLGLSGFLVAGGPAILSNLVSAWHGPGRVLRLPDPESGEDWRPAVLAVLLALYFAGLVAGVAVMAWRRRRVTSVYNVDTGRLEEVLGRVLDQLGFSWTRAGNRFYLRVSEPPASGSNRPSAEEVMAAGAVGAAASVGTAPPPSAAAEQTAVIDLEPFPAMHHVTVRWSLVGQAVRREVEGELTRSLAGVLTYNNPSGGWFLSAASMLVLVMATVVLLLLVTNILFRGV
jgi:hypothetical protein